MIRPLAGIAIASATVLLHAPLPSLDAGPIVSWPVDGAVLAAIRGIATTGLFLLPAWCAASSGARAAPAAALAVVLSVVVLVLATVQQRQLGRWPLEHAGLECRVDGLVVTPVDALSGFGGRPAWRFDLEPDTVRCPDGRLSRYPRRIRVTDWSPSGEAAGGYAAGERWQVTLRIEPPDGRLNPGSFDRERWLLLERIDASASVRGDDAQRMARATPFGGATVAMGRERWRERVAQWAPTAHGDTGSGAVAVLRALALGDKTDLDDRWRERLQATGTAHLVAISGLHVGLVFALLRTLALGVRRALAWRATQKADCHDELPGASRRGVAVAARLRRVTTRFGCRIGIDGAALLGAAAYAIMSGFELPVQRALVMLLAWVALQRRARVLARGDTLAMAALAVLAFDPLAPLSIGFWLSAGTVALLIAFGRGRGDDGAARAERERPGIESHVRAAMAGLARLGRLQLWLSLALVPITAWSFQQVSWVSPLANLVAIPFVGTLIVPLALGVALLCLFDALAPLASIGFVVLDAFVAGLAWLLDALAALPSASGSASVPDVTALSLALLAVLLGAAPVARARRLGVVLLLPMLALPSLAHNVGGRAVRGVELHALDVGHGLAVLILTEHRTWLYDTGGGRVETGSTRLERDVLPYLQALGRRRIDRLIVSHLDQDHSAGLAPLLERQPDVRVLVPDVAEARARLPGARRAAAAFDTCAAGMSFAADGVHAAVLHPAPGDGGSDNDRSCVLLISVDGASVLLTGDIERAGEHRLVTRAGGLPIDVLFAPHHGSDSSSGQRFVEAFPARHVVFAAARRSRWGFPHASVRMRYNQSGARLHTIGETGALVFRLGERPGRRERFGNATQRTWIPEPDAFRRASRRLWRLS